jgi:hypothetical protein
MKAGAGVMAAGLVALALTGCASLAAIATPDPFRPDRTVERDWIVFGSARSGEGDLYALPLDAAEAAAPARITDHAWPEGSPRFDPLRNELIYMTFDPAEAGWMMAWPEEERGAILGLDTTPAFSARTDLTAWHAADGEAGDRIFIAARGPLAIERRLTDGDAVERYPAFSPDGRRIAFVRSTSEGWVIVEHELDGGYERVVFGPEPYIGHLAYSSYGTRIAFDFQRGNETDIGLLTLEQADRGPRAPLGDPPLVVIARPGMDFAPAWVGREGAVVFNGVVSQGDQSDMELFLRRPEQAPVRLTTSPGFDGGATAAPASAIGQD